MKIVTNRCHGGFGLSDKAIRRYAEIHEWQLYPEISTDGRYITYWTVPPSDEARTSEHVIEVILRDYNIPRHDPALIQVVEEFGIEANGRCAELEITIIPDGIEYQIGEYDGLEWVAEKHRIW